MKSLDERIADRIKRKQDAGNEIDPVAFAERSDQSDAPTAGTGGEDAGAPGAQDAEDNLSGNGSGVGAVDLDAMTVAELKTYAADNGIDLGDATRKDDIRAAIDLAKGN